MRNAILLVLASVLGLQAAAQSYKVTNFISDGSVPAATMDANFLNPWAMSVSGTWWISTANSGYNYVVSSATVAAGTISFKVIIPSASGTIGSTGLPAGSVTTGGTVGMVLPAPNSTKANFLFSTLDGAIAGWNSKLGTANAVTMIVINNRSAGASYPGLAILNIATAGVTSTSYILAANFSGGAIEVYDSTFKVTKLGNNFVDPSLPPGYSPFSVHVLNNQVYVAYALHTAATPAQAVTGSGNGVVNVFDNAGNFVSRVVTFGDLNAPWGVAIAPANFGVFSSALLIGNFGDGKINAYDPKTFAYLGQLMDATGKPLTYASLWELLPGGTPVTGGTPSGGDTSTVYFTAGLTGQVHGLLAGITNGTTTGSTATYGFSASAGAATIPAGSSTSATVSVAPANGFSGSVALACSGLPAAATCTFSPASLTVSSSAVATGTVTIQTSKSSASLRPSRRQNILAAGIASALLLPFASLVGMRRRRTWPRLLCVMLVFAAATGFIAGCSDDSSSKPTPSTPAGQSTVSITATSGSITQTSTFALTVQ